ncbi:DUF2493 domain-containing protein [Devosia sp. RR2S18]|uniref:DUF2493 domain-containing protein n=1 Tax=Devosia rhizosphaerae TaxID=3049774 RepID=UPI0025419C19|nr:DUF2493 domain-containing protein [Devosia sp. RR2S18]WIJ25768.1 DUF2493 domain-containing protein [Devosia sp. RR2S18]
MMFDLSEANEPDHLQSPTSRVTSDLELYGYRPTREEHDHRPLPDDQTVTGTLAEMFDVLSAALTDTCLEPELENLLWSTVNTFHRTVDRMQRQLDRNEDAQKRSQLEQDGSEVKSVALEHLIEEGQLLSERRDSMEFFRDTAAELFEMRTGSAWRPRAGSMINHKHLTAALIDSRDYLAAKRRAETLPLLQPGTRIAFAGGLDCNDHQKIWDVLDKVRAKHADMVLLHGGNPRGAERIAASWAENRKVVQITFKPDWTRHAKAAPFKRNDQLLATLPTGVIVFPGSGITDNLVDKARQLGIPVWKFGEGRA